MTWTIFLARIGAGVFLANGIPHFIHGISGKRFQSPFASPPGVGESSPLINVIWGIFNLVIGYLLLYGVGDFVGGLSLDMLLVGVGAVATAVALALHFGRVREAK